MTRAFRGAPIHPSAWKMPSANFATTGFSEGRPYEGCAGLRRSALWYRVAGDGPVGAAGRIVVAVDDGSIILTPEEGKTVSFSGNRVTLIHGHPGRAYSVAEWVSEPGIPGPPLHIHSTTDEAFYVVEGTFGFRAGERTFEGGAGAFVFAPKGLEHTYWNEGKTPAKMLITISPPGFERYFEELAADLAIYFPGVCVPLGWQLRRRSSSDAVELAANHHEWHPFAPAVPDIEGDADERNEARKGGPDR